MNSTSTSCLLYLGWRLTACRSSSTPTLQSCSHTRLHSWGSLAVFFWQIQCNWCILWPIIINIWTPWKCWLWKEGGRSAECCFHTFDSISLTVGILRVNQSQKHWIWKKEQGGWKVESMKRQSSPVPGQRWSTPPGEAWEAESFRDRHLQWGAGCDTKKPNQLEWGLYL